MRQILFVKYNRTRAAQFQLKTEIAVTGKKVNKKLKYISSNTKYATVTQTGVVKAKKAGKGKYVTITAAATDGSNKKGKIRLKIK